MVCGRTFRMSLSGARTVGGPFHRWRPPVGTPIMSVSANGEQYTQSRQKGSVKQGQGFKELPIFQTAISMGANYRRKRWGMQRQMPLLSGDAHLDWMNAKPTGINRASWTGMVKECVISIQCFLFFVSLMQVHSCECEWTGSSPNLPWPLYTLEQIGRHCTSSHLLSIDSDIVMLSARACIGLWARSVFLCPDYLTEVLGNYHNSCINNIA